MPGSAEYCSSCGGEILPGAGFCTHCGSERAPQTAAATPSEEHFRGMLEIRRVGIWSVIKLSFLTNAVLGLIVGLLIAALGMSGMGMAAMPLPLQESGPLGMAPWIGVIVFAPILYGLLGALFGLILAVLYNVMAWGAGGIRISVRQP